MAIAELPAPDLLRQLLKYSPETGEMVWLERSLDLFPNKKGQVWWNIRHAGNAAASTISRGGYRTVKIFRSRFLAHRVIWAIHHGNWPTGQIDHINGDRTDNRIENLRDVSRQENQRNMKRCQRNKSGVTGVCYDKRTKSWSAYISRNGRQEKLGRFVERAAAIAARKNAEVAEGYHPNHGRILPPLY